jgi:PAS domain S-box-containing protein
MGRPIAEKKNDGNNLAILAQATDEAPKHAHVEQAFVNSESRYRRLFESVKDGILILNAKSGEIDDVNPFLVKLLGIPHESFLKKNIWDIGFFNDIIANKDIFKTLQEEAYIRYDDLPLRTADGRQVDVEFISNLYMVDNVKVIQCNIRDISERKRIELALSTSRELLDRRSAELEIANKELEAFAYSVSHDLRAPLRTMDGFSLALLEDYGDTLNITAKDYLTRIRGASQHMAQLIDDMLKFSHITRVEMKRETVDISSLAMSIMKELQRSQPDRPVTLKIADNLIVEGDTNLLRVLLDNLLGNAWKYTARHPSAQIEVGSMAENGKTVYFVKDDGAGFDMAYVDKLFSPFSRLHTTDEFPGTGIGLATAQRIVIRHGGSIWVRGIVEKGATIYFTLNGNEGEGE